jgi:tetratricopeptide (TPR) repeat protein
LSEELLNSLTKIPDLLVTARTSSFAFKWTDKTVQYIAEVLGVAHVLEGSVRKAGNALRITAQLIRASDGFHLWSETYDRELKDIFTIQEDIATTVADELKITLGIDRSLRPLGGTDDIEAYELYLVAKGQVFVDYGQALESIDAAIAIDPEFADAWALKASIHWWRAVSLPSNLVTSEYDVGLSAAMKAIELEPNLGKAYLSLGISRLVRGEFIEAELAYRNGMELTTESIDVSEYGLFEYYASVGYFKRAHEIIEAARQEDPLNEKVRASYIFSLGILGDMQGAEEEYERGKALFGDQWDLGDLYISFFRIGSKDVVSRDDIVLPYPIWDITKEHLDSTKDGLAELRKIYYDNNNRSSGDFAQISICAAFFGDLEFAMDALEKAVIIESSCVFAIWQPVMRQVRQLPRFKEFVREIGLVDYWNEFGWPDICRPVGDGDFECD